MIGLFIGLYFLYKCVFFGHTLRPEQGASLISAVMVEFLIECMIMGAILMWKGQEL